jgi:Biotin-protein ligase, N terminal
MNGAHTLAWLLVGLTLPLTACRGSEPAGDSAAPRAVLLFVGRGASAGDVAALEQILSARQVDYGTVTSEQLNRMPESALRASRLLVVPGGNFEEIGHGLTSSTTGVLRNAIRNGLNYLGICAGAFFAGNSPYNGLNLTSDVRFPFYAAESRGIRKTAVAISTPGGPILDQYWEDGPQLAGWGEAVAKYPDGTSAIAQGTFGEGWVILSGVHPEAPDSWRRGLTFTTPASVDNAYAATLIDAALHRTRLPHY